jgi:hypothetical protein
MRQPWSQIDNFATHVPDVTVCRLNHDIMESATKLVTRYEAWRAALDDEAEDED